MLSLLWNQRFLVQASVSHLRDHREKQIASIVLETLFLVDLFLISKLSLVLYYYV